MKFCYFWVDSLQFELEWSRLLLLSLPFLSQVAGVCVCVCERERERERERVVYV